MSTNIKIIVRDGERIEEEEEGEKQAVRVVLRSLILTSVAGHGG